MKIIVDDKIPYIREALGEISPDVTYLKGADISAGDVEDADALIVRTRTRCDGKLLQGSKVQFVATATIGYDHIDTEYMQKAGISWMNCPGSISLCQGIPDKGSSYAEEGTLAHSLAELIINYNLSRMTKAEFKEAMKDIESNSFYCQEMQDYIKDYTECIWELMNEAKAVCKDAELLTEQRLDFSAWVPGGFGTGDVVIVYDKVIHICDLKYGKGVGVSAERNPQLMLYGLGALSTYDMLYDIETVVKPAAAAALADSAECTAGDWCRFCKAKAVCRARKDAMTELAGLEFKDARLLDDSEIGEVLRMADLLTAWAGDVKEYAQEEAEKGKKWDGWKLVEGRSNRKYSDEAKVAEALKNAGYDEALLYEKKLYGITAMEKIIGKKPLAEFCGALIIKPPGKPVLVPESDKRPEINSADSAVKDFE